MCISLADSEFGNLVPRILLSFSSTDVLYDNPLPGVIRHLFSEFEKPTTKIIAAITGVVMKAVCC
jgi:hypothetical protein